MIASNVGKFNLSGPGYLHPMNEMNEPEEGEVAAAVASFNSLKKKKKNLVHRTHTQKNRIKFYVPGHLEQRKYSRVSVR